MPSDRARSLVLECLIGKALVGVPREHVREVVEVSLVPLPLPARFVGGVGIVHGRVTVAVLLTRPDQKPRMAKGVVLSVESADVGFLLEVSSVAGFVPISAANEPREGTSVDKMPAWVERGRTVDGRALAWLNIPAMVREVASGL